MKPVIGCLGAGRMGRGIAVVFAFAGHQVVVVDFKEREASAFEALAAEARAEIRSTLEILSRIDLLPAELVPTIAERITIVSRQEAAAALPRCDVIFEGMPEILALEASGAGRGLAAGGRSARSSLRPRRRYWSTISRDRSNIPAASSMRTGSIRPIWCR